MNKEEQWLHAVDLLNFLAWDLAVDSKETIERLNKMGYRPEKETAHDICRFLLSFQRKYEQKNEYEKAAVVYDLLRNIIKKYDITDWEDLI